MEKKTFYSLKEIIKCGKGKLFGTDNARLPVKKMRMIDRIVKIVENGGKYGKGEIIAELDINPKKWFFKCHFPGDPVMPGCLGLDALWQLLGFYLGWKGFQGKGRALGVGEVKFTGQILPQAQKVLYHLDIKRVMASKLKMVIGDGSVLVDGRLIYMAQNLKVGLFASTEGF